MNRLLALYLPLVLLAAAPVKPNPSLGKAEAHCRPSEPGPALIVTAVGLKDRRGLLRAELYPDNDADFLQDDAILINQGKTFRRAEIDLATTAGATLCMRVPSPGRYALSLLHDRDGNLKFGIFSDGIGFSGNPKLKRSKPPVSSATIVAGPGLTKINIVMNYLHGLSFRPEDRK